MRMLPKSFCSQRHRSRAARQRRYPSPATGHPSSSWSLSSVIGLPLLRPTQTPIRVFCPRSNALSILSIPPITALYSPSARHPPTIGPDAPLFSEQVLSAPPPKQPPLATKVLPDETMSQPPASSKAAASSNKAASNSSIQSPSLSQTQQFFSNPRAVSGSSAANQRSSGGTPRNNQSAKPKHKAGRKFQVLDDDEQAAMHAIGRRGKQADITHLMNIALPPRPNQGSNHRHSYNGPRRGGGRYNSTWGLGSGYHAVDKARSVQDRSWAIRRVRLLTVF